MTFHYESAETANAQKHWSGWSARRPKHKVTINNYLSALVLALSAATLVANHMT